MNATEKNEKIARQIINLLADNDYSVGESQEVLKYVSNTIISETPVAKVNNKLYSGTIQADQVSSYGNE